LVVEGEHGAVEALEGVGNGFPAVVFVEHEEIIVLVEEQLLFVHRRFLRQQCGARGQQQEGEQEAAHPSSGLLRELHGDWHMDSHWKMYLLTSSSRLTADSVW